ncbi:hypothetical protein [Nesterenkonia alba]|uniref:hypothetical protein n=1 Tax=Nesterenkonia alba TaxID=515814 RepID=UPI0003B403AE|nr:hypothetical protein [Nesterenkonia alba]
MILEDVEQALIPIDETVSFWDAVSEFVRLIEIDTSATTDLLHQAIKRVRSLGYEFAALTEERVIVDLLNSRHVVYPGGTVAADEAEAETFNALPFEWQASVLLNAVSPDVSLSMEQKTLTYLADVCESWDDVVYELKMKPGYAITNALREELGLQPRYQDLDAYLHLFAEMWKDRGAAMEPQERMLSQLDFDFD